MNKFFILYADVAILTCVLVVAGCGEKVEPKAQIMVGGASGVNAPVSKSGEPMTGALPDADFKVKIEPQITELNLTRGEAIFIPVKITNLGNSSWSSAGKDGQWGALTVAFSYHVLNKDGKIVVLDGKRTGLPGNVLPNQSVLLNVNVEGPEAAGSYVYVFDMVQEGVSWFEGKGSVVSKINANVK